MFGQYLKKTSPQLIWLVLAALVSIFVCANPIQAGGGNVMLEPDTMVTSSGRPINVRAYLLDEEARQSPQNIQIRIRNQWPSANCTQNTTLINEQGFVTATCTTTSDGLMEIYGVWIERGDESGSMFLEFRKEQMSMDPAEPASSTQPNSNSSSSNTQTTPVVTPTPVVTTKPTPKPTPSPSPSPTSDPNALTLYPTFDDQRPGSQTSIVARTPVQNATVIAGLLLGLTALLLAGSLYARKRKLTRAILFLAGIGVTLMAGAGVYAASTTPRLMPSETVYDSGLSPILVEEPELTEITEPTETSEALPSVSPAITDIKVTISGQLLHDQNCDYIKNPGEPGLANLEVPIYAFNTPRGNVLLARVTTNSEGIFSYTHTIKSNQQITLDAPALVWGYGMNNYPEIPGAVTLSAKKPKAHQLYPLYLVGGSCSQEAR